MKERSILFSGPMVLAILEGRKTQTRRIVKSQRHPYGHLLGPEGVAKEFIGGTEAIRCPYGQPGDRLWVRETWRVCRKRNKELAVQYIADNACGSAIIERLPNNWPSRIIPSIHMPRWASRITLEIVSVRVERLNDISEDSAWAEGMNHGCIGNDESFAARSGKGWPYEFFGFPAKMRFAQLWECINGLGSWDLNPWVWVLEFKEVKP